MEEPFSIFTMQGFCNNIYGNYREIIGWGPNNLKNNVDRVTALTADASDIGTEGGGIPEGEVKMVQGTYFSIPRRL